MDIRKIVALFDVKLTHRENVQKAFEFVCENYKILPEQHERLQEKIYKTFSKYKMKWQDVNRKKHKFNEYYRSWLDADFGIEQFIVEVNVPSTSSASASSTKRGRPSKPFSDLSERGKRRIIDNQIVDPKVDTVEKALLVARRTAYNQRELNMVKVIGHVLKNQESSKKMLAQLTDERGLMSAEEAFSVLIEAGFSKFQYELIHRESPSRFPPYDVIKAVKKNCGPPSESIEGTGSKFKVNLQALMVNTVKRIVKIVDAEISGLMDSMEVDCVEMVLLSSWGMDGSTGYAQYNQELPEGCQDDKDVFSSTITPIRLFLHNDQKNIIWYNPMPQSIRFCRPFILEFIKESREIIIATKKATEKEMSELTPVQVELTSANGKSILVDFNFALSMINGKVLTYVTGGTSMQNCPICRATPNIMNSAEKLEEGFVSNEEALHYGISPLHAWIRFFECLLHISYRMDFKMWQTTKPFKDLYEQRKKQITTELYEKFKVRVDQPRSGGSGTSTTGNICRRVFSNPQLLSSVLKIDEELIERFRNILITINCQEAINPEKVDAYCKDTYRLYLEKYDWYKIPATVHKVLAHAGEIIMHSPAPLGTLAEEAAESQHKKLKKYRTHHARKRSRVDNLHDVFMRAMHESDPYISSIWMAKRRQKGISQDYPEVVKSFLIFEDTGNCSTADTSNCNVMEELMKAVGEIDEDFVLDDIEAE